MKPCVAGLLCLLSLALAPVARPHDLWLERAADGLWLRYGHLPTGHAGASLIDYRPEVVQRIACHDAAGRPVECRPTPGSPLHIECPCAVACVLTSSGYWTKTAYETRNVPKSEVEAPVRGWLSYESVKRIDAWTDALARPLTEDLELVPLENPLTLEPGEKLELLVTRGGQPVEGAVVTYDDKPRGQTGKDGRIHVRIKHAGLQSLQAGLTLPGDGLSADEIVHTTTLNFEPGPPR